MLLLIRMPLTNMLFIIDANAGAGAGEGDRLGADASDASVARGAAFRCDVAGCNSVSIAEADADFINGAGADATTDPETDKGAGASSGDNLTLKEGGGVKPAPHTLPPIEADEAPTTACARLANLRLIASHPIQLLSG